MIRTKRSRIITCLGLSAVALALEEDEERKAKRSRTRKCYVRRIIELRPIRGEYERLIADMEFCEEVQWQREYFRMSNECYRLLLEKVRPFLQHAPTHRYPISPEARLALTIKMLGSGHMPSYEHKNSYCGYSTAIGIFHETCEAIWNALHDECMKFPAEEGWKKISEQFLSRWNFPACVGAIDGKHVVIQKPRGGGSQYYNYKKDHSIVLMAAATADYCFSYIDVGAFGRASDGGVFNRCSLGRKLYEPGNQLNLPGQVSLPGTDKRTNFLFVADDAFALGPRIMKPYSGSTLDISYRVFNYRLSRRIVENVFGILSTKWRIFRRPIAYSHAHVVALVKAACVLHNFVRITGADDQYCPAGYVDSDADTENGNWRQIALPPPILEPVKSGENPRQRNKLGTALRDQLREYFMSEAGSVPWQLERAQRL